MCKRSSILHAKLSCNSSYTVFDTDGIVLWQQTTQDYSSGNTGSAVFDFEGDGIAEAIYPDELHLWAFNGPDGAVKLNSPEHSSNTWTEYAVIADLDNDNHAEIIVPNNDTVSGGFYTGITVLTDADNSWQAGTRIWNQHAYSITNVNEDGTIPAMPDPNWLPLVPPVCKRVMRRWRRLHHWFQVSLPTWVTTKSEPRSRSCASFV